jgi:hypothetical protein
MAMQFISGMQTGLYTGNIFELVANISGLLGVHHAKNKWLIIKKC